MSRLLRRSSLRHLTRHPWQVGLSVLAIALGVAVVVSVDLAIQSARQAFTLSAEAVGGRATHRVVGGSAGLPDSLYRRLRLEAGSVPSAPVVVGDVELPGRPGSALRLLGVDPFAEGDVRPYLGAGPTGAVDGRRVAEDGAAAGSADARGAAEDGAGGGVLTALLTRPGAVLLSRSTATRLGVGRGDSLAVVAGGARRTVHLAGVLAPADESSRRALDDLVVADIATAQELLGRIGRLDRIDLVAPPDGDGRGVLDRVRSVLPAGAELAPADERVRTLRQMVRAFDINLRALSLLTLLFGAFLIYNSMAFSVVQRRRLLGTVRALGVTRRELFALLLGEAAVLGAVGTAVGIGLGAALAHGLVGLVSRTINDLYFAVAVRDVAITAAGLARGAGLGLGATLLAAVPPAWEATTAPPHATLARSTLEDRFRDAAPGLAGLGSALLVAGGAVLTASGNRLALSFAGVFVVFLGFALLTPAATVGLMRLLRPALRRAVGVLGAMAARGVSRALSRTAPAVAALMIGIAVSIGIGVMIDSFRQTVVGWLDATLHADVYVSAAGGRSGGAEPALPPGLVHRLGDAAGVAAVSNVRGAVVPSPEGDARVLALGGDPRGRNGYRLRERDPDAAWAEVDEGAVLVSEPFAYRRGLGPGDTVRLRTGTGERGFPVAGVFYDYGSDRGVVLMDRSTYDRSWNDPGVSGLAVFGAPGRGADSLTVSLRRVVAAAAGPTAAPGRPVVRVRSNRALRQASLRVFDRTFTITGVLRLLTLLVAFIAMLAALMALQLERGREVGVLRATGLTPGQVWRLSTARTGLMGLAAGLFALPAGYVLALIMVHVINRRSFGWTMEMHVEPLAAGQALLLGLVAAVLAGLYPAAAMARTEPAAALREE